MREVPVHLRQRVRVRGSIQRVVLGSWGTSPSLECLLADKTGELWLVLLGRRELPGLDEGTEIAAMGTPGIVRDRVIMLNPLVEILRRGSGPGDCEP
jgi:hypothetical protein